MIGIGPLITIPLVIAALHGPLSLSAWLLGALIAGCDGLVWAELGAAIPESGGLYAFFLRLFGEKRAGRWLAFLYVWQFLLTAPFLLASGYIGFAQYATYIWPALRGNDLGQHLLAVGVGIVTIAVLSRVIGRIARIGEVLFAIACATLLLVIAASWSHFVPARAFDLTGGIPAPAAFIAGLGSGLVITLYDYLGYNTTCSLGDEVRAPARIMPRSILWSLLIVGAMYLALQIGVLGVVPWREIVGTGATPPDSARFVASDLVERTWGVAAAGIVTTLVLITAFASTFASLLAFSRVPYAAARDGLFFRAFARLHPRDAYPTVSLLAFGVLALPVCFLPLDAVLSVIGIGLIVFGGIGAFASMVMLRRSGRPMPYRMPLFPLPPLIALAGWSYAIVSAGPLALGFTAVSVVVGSAVYAFVYARSRTAASAGSDTS